jgi:hypothetical protein
MSSNSKNSSSRNNKVGRSEDEVELKSLPVSGADLSKLRTEELDRKVSLDSKKLTAIMNKEQLVEAIKDTYFTLSFDYDFEEPEPKGLNSKNKKDLVAILIKMREQYLLQEQQQEYCMSFQKYCTVKHGHA